MLIIRPNRLQYKNYKQGRTLYNNNDKHAGTQNQSPKMHRAKTDRIESMNRQFNNNSWRLQYPLTIMGRSTRQKINKNIQDWNNYKPDIYNRYLQNTSSNKSKCMFLSSTHGTFYSSDYILDHKEVLVNLTQRMEKQ